MLDENGGYVNSLENAEKIISNNFLALRNLMGTDHDGFMMQLCAYKDMAGSFDNWRSDEDELQRVLADTTMTADERKEAEASFQSPGKMMPLYFSRFSDAYLHQKALSAKYPGRFLMIDFWGMGCGPCRSAIQNSKNLRTEVAKRDDIKLIFIAGERTPEGSEAYHNYVKEWLADEETICLSNTDFTRMQELFRFNGIPHYETITPDGRRVRDDLNFNGYYNFDFTLNRLKEKLK